VARLLAPIEASIGYWKQFVLARHSLDKLQEFCALPNPRPSDMCLPDPCGEINVSGLTYVPPGVASAALRNVSFHLPAGEMLAIVGPSASGKTTLSRLIVGVLRPTGGHVRLDSADTFAWKRSDLGPRIGYLPQDIELLPGTVRANIARFREGESDERVIDAARLADCHEMILQLRGGYDLVLGDGGYQLSGGQRQRVGLARALFGDPRLVVLDEPNSSLDSIGEKALLKTIAYLRRKRITTIVVSHRTNLLKLADRILVLQEGRAINYGPAAQVMAQFEGRAVPQANGTTPKAVEASGNSQLVAPEGVS
jgi:ATP-binding cassette, subfamily C, bacterial exporter for protease/lipase